ncbi:IS66 family insertion sequence element accessory protein TnpB [Paraburkholderia sp. GAS199]|uniref:IS66 family insertion sequence element accessory protein TnpB n=1 Tax=Paraburkholderia sp. GAS199 TaxID=3035126 RepID=UPI003D1B2019
MRAGFNSLAAKVQTVLERDPFCGHVFVFRGKRGDLLKVLWWSGDGMRLLMKRLEKKRFVWPQADGGVICLSPAQISMLLEGASTGGNRRERHDRRRRCKRRRWREIACMSRAQDKPSCPLIKSVSPLPDTAIS